MPEWERRLIWLLSVLGIVASIGLAAALVFYS